MFSDSFVNSAFDNTGSSPEVGKKPPFRKAFSRIYVEEGAYAYERTRMILGKLPGSTVIPVGDYKNVFNRPNQAAALQKQAPALILAVLKPPYLYPGAVVCQDFGERHFYYTSCVMNCPYDCEYCYLQGMYPSGDIVVFVNLEDVFREISGVLKEHPLYLCISFDTDLPALEGLTGFLSDWADFAVKNPSLLLEVRTKSSAVSAISKLPVTDNMIFAVTVSPERISRRFEHRTPPPADRLVFARTALLQGRQVRLCFDPMIRTEDFETLYGELFEQVRTTLPADRLRDVSVGTFRISAEYLKRMRKSRPCEVTAYPYTNTGGVYGYEPELVRQMLAFAREKLTGFLPEEKIFFSEELPEGQRL